MPPLGSLHPQIVHFVIALGLVGVFLRIISLFWNRDWIRYSATVLLLIAATASVLAVISGDKAHGPAERIPGARSIVHDHESAGEWTRNLLLIIAAIELGALAVRKRSRGTERGLLIASALVGVAASVNIYRTGKLGGDLVYGYAGGVGMRAGDTDAVRRLLVAGLYHRARIARDSGRKGEAARLTRELAQQVPGDASVQLLAATSLLKDDGDAAAARALIEGISVPADDPRLVTQRGALLVETLRAQGHADSATALLDELLGKYPESRVLKELK